MGMAGAVDIVIGGLVMSFRVPFPPYPIHADHFVILFQRLPKWQKMRCSETITPRLVRKQSIDNTRANTSGLSCWRSAVTKVHGNGVMAMVIGWGKTDVSTARNA
jgi:hypothetical protein